MKDKNKSKAQPHKESAKLRQRVTKVDNRKTKQKKTAADIETRKKRGQARDRLEKELTAIATVMNDMLRGEMDDAKTEDRVLDACLAATDSVYGMIGVINEHGKYDTTTYSSNTLQDCAFPEALAWELSTGMTIRGVWGWAMLHGKPLICNDLKTFPDRVGLPKGHVALKCFLGVPLKHGEETVGMVAVANKLGGYTQEDKDTLVRLASVVSLSRRHRLALIAAKRTSVELERLVEEQTKQLRDSEIRFRGIFESKMIGTLFWDGNGDITDANDVFLQMVGYTRDEVLSRKVRWRDMTPPEYKDLDDKALEEIAAKGVMIPIEKEYIHKDGSRIPILLGAASLPGPTLSGVAFVLDITERKKAHDELEEKVAERTKELKEKISELERFYNATVDRELRMKELRDKIKELESRLKEKKG